MLNFAPRIFSIPWLLPTSGIYSAFVAVWDIFCFYIARYCIKQVTYYHALVQWIFEQKWQEPQYPSIAQSLDIREEHFATTCCMHATKFAQHLLNHLRSIAMFAFTQLNSIWAAFMLPLSSHYIHSVALALRHTHAAAALRALHWSSRRHAKEAEGPKIWSNSEGHCWDLRQLPSLMQHCVHAEGCSPTRCLSTTFCALLVS